MKNDQWDQISYNNIFNGIYSKKTSTEKIARQLCARADARTAFQDSLFVKMVRSDDDDDDDDDGATKAKDPRVGLRFV